VLRLLRLLFILFVRSFRSLRELLMENMVSSAKIRSGVRRRHFRLRIHGEVHPTMPVEVTRSVSSKQWRCALDGGADLDSGIPEAQVTELAEGGIARAISANLPSEGGG
jgi:hypothetical protein